MRLRERTWSIAIEDWLLIAAGVSYTLVFFGWPFLYIAYRAMVG